MDRDLEAIVTSAENIETEVLSSNNVLTLITTEDGIPTSTEVTVLTASLGDVPIMTATQHPTFVTSHGGLRTVYTTSLIPSNAIAGQAVVLSNGQLAVMGADGIRRTLVVHAAGPEHMELETESQNIVTVEGVDIQIQEASSDFPTTVVLTEEEANRLTQGSTDVLSGLQEVTAEVIETDDMNVNVNALVQEALVIESPENQITTTEAEEASLPQPLPPPPLPSHDVIEEVVQAPEEPQVNKSPEEVISDPKASPQVELDLKDLKQEKDKSSEEVVPPPVPEVPPPPPIPEDVVCLVCYESFKNPKRKDLDLDLETNTNDNVNTPPEIDQAKHLTCYGRTLGKFFEISRINMSIVTRRSYKEYEVPLCPTCAEKLDQAEKFLEELKQLERRLYYLRQEIKDVIVSSHCVYKKKENKEVLEQRRQIAGLVEILNTVDHIRLDIINDGRPPRIPKSMTGNPGKEKGRPGRKPKKIEEVVIGEGSQEQKTTSPATDTAATASTSVETSILPDIDPQSTEKTETCQLNVAKEEVPESKPEENEEKDVKPAIRTSFGRLVKRPAYMLNELTEDELSEIDEDSEDNYEEIEVKPAILAEGEPGVVNEEVDIEEEDPAWSPGRGLFIDDEKIISASSEESEYFSDDSDVDGVPKMKIKKEPRHKKLKKARTKTTKKRTRKSQSKSGSTSMTSEVGYEVKVIQLDGTELMSINTHDENGIGLEPDITQKVMDSQAVIMVKNQLFGKRVQCPHCPRSFTDAARRDVHVKKKHEGVAKPFECPVCRKGFGRQDHLKNHMKRHTRPQKDKTSPKPRQMTSEKNHACEFCDQRFRNKSELMIHTRMHTGEKPFKCEHCSESFISALKKEFHIEQAHPEVAPLKCEFCPKAYFRPHRLRIHAVSHTGEKTNICEICGKSFSQAAMLRYHQTTHEELHLKQFKCQECSRVFANPQNLKSHMESQHQKVYRHRCDTCGRGYTQMSHLRRHLRTHSGEQPFVCSYCPKKFTSGAALKIHVRIHTGERPYWCSQCEKGFRSKTKLGRHLKTLIHSGEKFKKEHALTTEIETVDVNAATSTTWTEIVGIITGV